MWYEIIIGNIGLWETTDNEREARLAYWKACKHVLQNGGRGEGEPVYLLEDGEPIDEYHPSNKQGDE